MTEAIEECGLHPRLLSREAESRCPLMLPLFLEVFSLQLVEKELLDKGRLQAAVFDVAAERRSIFGDIAIYGQLAATGKGTS